MSPSREVIIVGSGLFGSIAAALARQRGHSVTVVSNNEPMAASKASGCVLAPSWLSSLDKQQIATGMETLRALYTVHDVEFQSSLGVVFKAQRVDPDKILLPADITDEVVEVRNGYVALRGRKDPLRGQVLVAAGVWGGSLVQMPPIQGRYGASVRFRAHLPHPKIHVYMPYRQAIAYQLNKNEVWVGDGTALIRKTWEAERSERIQKTVDRGVALIGSLVKGKVTEGIRPFVEGHKNGYFDRPYPRTWVSNGGGKTGTVLAAYQAARFVKEAGL